MSNVFLHSFSTAGGDVMATYTHSHREGEECSCVLHSSAVAQTLDVG